MNIYETLQTVKKLEKLCVIQSDIQARIEKIKRKNTRLKLMLFRLVHWSASAMFWLLVIAVFFGIINYCQEVGKEYNTFDIFGICVYISGIPVILYFIFKSIFDKYERKRAYTKKEQIVYDECESQYNKAEAEINMLLAELDESPIPYKYWHSYALEWMIDAIECKRANSLTELINLYEQFADAERRHNEQLEMLYQTRTNVKVDVRVY